MSRRRVGAAALKGITSAQLTDVGLSHWTISTSLATALASAGEELWISSLAQARRPQWLTPGIRGGAEDLAFAGQRPPGKHHTHRGLRSVPKRGVSSITSVALLPVVVRSEHVVGR
jgi:hypothetical protein